ncbi:CapA family protein [uncultured Tenacibaculum sp.]|uniref:CapA family protein n=1 Tax=uncultured Tenacibaculum sp. TaxID=174713 RepID=UPI00262D89AB|nr:CapA family protein [uncultured Tenacibaculum sp.]
MDTNNINITFTGDLNISGAFVSKVVDNDEIFCSELKSEFQRNDYVVCNLEGPTTSAKFRTTTQTVIKSPRETISYLSRQNIKVFNLANNHIFDADSTGVDDTILEIEQHKCLYFGITNEQKDAVQIIEKNGIKIGLIGVAHTFPYELGKYSIPKKSFNQIKKLVEKLSSITDHIVVNFHGFEEFTVYPSPVKRKFLQKVASLKKVSIVIAHHSHTFQGFEHINTTPVFYSLGNFVFDIPNHKMYDYVNSGALVRFQFRKTDFSFDFVPFSINDGFVKKSDDETFMNHLHQISDFSNYSSKWRKEAHRTLFRKNNPKIAPQQEGKTLQNSSLLSILFSRKFYQKCKLILGDRTMFSVYSNAIYQKIRNRFSLKKHSE